MVINVVENVGRDARIQNAPQFVVRIHQSQRVHLEPVVDKVHPCVSLHQRMGAVNIIELEPNIGFV